jgi:hypothetical protein
VALLSCPFSSQRQEALRRKPLPLCTFAVSPLLASTWSSRVAKGSSREIARRNARTCRTLAGEHQFRGSCRDHDNLWKPLDCQRPMPTRAARNICRRLHSMKTARPDLERDGEDRRACSQQTCRASSTCQVPLTAMEYPVYLPHLFLLPGRCVRECSLHFTGSDFARVLPATKGQSR